MLHTWLRKGGTLALAVLLFISAGCSTSGPQAGPGKSQSGGKDSQPSPTPTVEDPLKDQIARMTLDQKIGQMVIGGVDGLEMDEHARQLIDTYKVGGFILFKPNVKSAAQAVGLLNSLKEENARTGSKIPLMLSVDEEGGRVSRMPDEYMNVPASQVIGSTKNLRFAAEIGDILAREVASLGFNTDFAPVLDINSNPKNPVIGDRSFGSAPELVGNLGVEMMKAIAAQKVIPVVKHFPGHGDTAVDSHIGLPVVEHDASRLRSFELVPFVKAFQSGADAVMVAHILLPKLDSTYPASLSPAVITDLLRKELNFGGVVFTDDLTMGAIVKSYGIGEAAVQAVKAGTDVALVCHEFDNTVRVVKALKQAAETGVLSERRIDESVYRILKLKYKYTLADRPAPQPDVGKINEQIGRVLDARLP
ncbi:beta-N-acetylhexosaminidase [Paenibacillus chitinolyticus]|uniref:beta-N-acetylhexosaminidase n=1 Tax=Paenibacillus chitinolyticus TaxID=79263 RepID=UPI002DBBADF8|nr:beta-N-acetylhexosaminidase [Paenibacillus chitinolyticus]MEC0244874.1 beta-N-acetylhexosaminidase [Paenibacillus chitinolyticus]